ncbi:mechanosensitive ion channel [Apiospora kogelbergensis]|uniref:Mechanosensitive ion channel n=1 Tax=Apiospora kogelbergensis TaxID=1337665 RepID=A0AAW0QCP6_9PEZI
MAETSSNHHTYNDSADSGKQPHHNHVYDGSSNTLTRAPTVESEGDGDVLTQSDRETQSRRDHAARLNDDLTLLGIERKISNQEEYLNKSHSRRSDIIKEDVFNAPTNPNNLPNALPTTGEEGEPSKIFNALKRIKKLPRAARYIFYLSPTRHWWPGGVELLWFGIWLEIVWLTLWAARICTAILPFLVRFGAKILGSGNPKKWKVIGEQMELHTALFLWMLACLISFLPIVNNHKVPAPEPDRFPDIKWINIVQKVIIALFVLAALNFVEKMIIQWIANTFHKRTYMIRIDTNKQYIAYLVHLFQYSGDRLATEESVSGYNASGTKTPLRAFQQNVGTVFNKVGDVANRVAGDFTGREVRLSNHPRKVVSELLRNSSSAQVLARRLFRTYAKDGVDVLTPDDLSPAFPTEEDAEAAFSIFDRDLNGDVSLEELEAFCDEVHREKKAITASLKDLDSVIKKLDQTFLVIVIIITVIVFISIISASASAALASAGTAVLGLAWVLQATAQEFLQSIIFVFVKHPFDVGDRITVYGNTGATGTGDDYYVTEISLLYTEFKKMEGHIVQAPNSVLNTLFILNHRRSGSLADVFKLRMAFGTPKEMIEELQARMTEFVLANRRDYTGKIITELTTIEDTYCIAINFITFHKSSFQNELIRLTRHNKFAMELSKQTAALGIQQPRRQLQISGQDFPVYQTNIQPPQRTDSYGQHALPGYAEHGLLSGRLCCAPADPSLQPPPRIPEEAIASGANLEKTASKASKAGSSRGGLFHRTMTLRHSVDQNSTRSNDRNDMV